MPKNQKKISFFFPWQMLLPPKRFIQKSKKDAKKDMTININYGHIFYNSSFGRKLYKRGLFKKKSFKGKYSTIILLTWFQVLLSLLSEYFSPFHHCTCILLVSSIIFSFWEYLLPNLDCIPKQPDSYIEPYTQLEQRNVNRVIT